MASMLACLVGFSSCGSDGDEPTPDKPGGKGASKLVVNVESPGTFKQALEKKLPECILTVGKQYSIYSIDALVIKGSVNAEDIHVLHNYEEVFTTSDISSWNGNVIVLDFSNAQIIGSDYKGKSYKANHLYPVNGDSFGRGFKVIKYPQNIEVIEANALRSVECHDVSTLIRKDLKVIGDKAFYESLIIEENFTLVFQENLKVIGDFAFADLRHNGSIPISIDLSKAEQLTEIGTQAFHSKSIKGEGSIIIPKNVNKIGDGAFDMSRGDFSSVHMRSEIPPVCPKGYWIECDTLYVPKGCKKNYDKWGNSTYPGQPTMTPYGVWVHNRNIIEE